MREQLSILKDECRAVGRDFAKLDITLMGALKGERAEVQTELSRYAEIGVGRFVAGVGTLTPANFGERLAKLAGLYV
jgi:hypothetical protein